MKQQTLCVIAQCQPISIKAVDHWHTFIASATPSRSIGTGLVPGKESHGEAVLETGSTVGTGS